MSQSSTKKTGSSEPLYYAEILKSREEGMRQLPVDVCLKFVPRSHEINAVYHTPLTDLLSRNDLPLPVKLQQNLDFTWDRSAGRLQIKRGEILMLHFLIRPKRVLATDRKGEETVLPIFAKQLYDILPIEPSHDDKVFRGTAEVIKCKPLPKRLRVVYAFCSGNPQEAQEVGDIIDVSHIERHGNIKVLVGKDRTSRKQVSFPESMTSTYTTMIFDTPLSLSEIIKSKNLPVRIRKTEQKSETYMLLECKDEAQVVCTIPHWRQVFSLPLTSTIPVEHVTHCSSVPPLRDVTTQLYPLINTTWGIKEIGREALPDRLAEIPHPKIGILCDWINSKEGLELVDRISQGAIKSKNEIIANLKKTIRSLQMRVGASNAPPPLLPSRNKPSPSPPIKPSTFTKGMSPAVRPRAETTKARPSDDTYNVLQFPPIAAPRQNVNKQIEIDDLKKQIKTLQEEKKVHLPKIAELQAQVTRIPKNEYQSIPEAKPRPTSGPSYEVPDAILSRGKGLGTASIDEVVDFICSIGLTSYAGVFKGENIDGALLVELDEDIFHTELGLTKLNAKRLKMEIKKRET